MSRLYGGIHFRHDNAQGTFVGSIIGERVVERMRRGQRSASSLTIAVRMDR